MFSHHRWLAWHWKELGIGWVLICWNLLIWKLEWAKRRVNLFWCEKILKSARIFELNKISWIRLEPAISCLCLVHFQTNWVTGKLSSNYLKICFFYAGIVFSCPVVCCTSPPPNCLTSVWELSANCGNYLSFGKKLEIYRKKICASLMLIFASLTSNQRSRDQKQSCNFLLKWSALVIILIIIVFNEEETG